MNNIVKINQKSTFFKLLTAVLLLTASGRALAATGYVTGTTLEAQFAGTTNSDQSGYSIANVGDVNCDGIDDMLIGAPYQEASDGATNVGKVYLIYGVSGASPITGDQNLASIANAVFEGEQEYYSSTAQDNANTGYAVGRAGDVNGDGCGDFLIGAPQNFNSSFGSYAGYRAGKVYLLYGRSGSSSWSGEHSLSTADASFTGGKYDYLGKQVGSAGDVNGDGYADILMYADGKNSSASSYTTNAGKTYLLYGASGGIASRNLMNSDNAEQCSTDGARSSCVVFTGDTTMGYAGTEFTHGDLNRDGYDDIVISAPGLNKTYLIYGSRSRLAGKSLANFAAKFSSAGYTACVGDVTGDGKVDLIMANSQFQGSKTLQGRGYVIKGIAPTSVKYSGNYELTTSSIVVSTISGDSYDRAGYSLSCGGDVNGDGIHDVLIGAQDSGAPGSAYLLYGGFASGDIDLAATSSAIKFSGESTFALLGHDVDVTGDYNDDGKADLIMSAIQTYGTTSDGGGLTYLYYGF